MPDEPRPMSHRDRVAAARGRVKRWLLFYDDNLHPGMNDRLACSFEDAPLYASDLRTILLTRTDAPSLFTSGPLTVERPCASCGRPYSPDHDSSAPGPTVRHPFVVDRSNDDPATYRPRVTHSTNTDDTGHKSPCLDCGEPTATDLCYSCRMADRG